MFLSKISTLSDFNSNIFFHWGEGEWGQREKEGESEQEKQEETERDFFKIIHKYLKLFYIFLSNTINKILKKITFFDKK